jgi:hypothetical protein
MTTFGYIWCGAVVLGYLAHALLSEHGGGIVFDSGFGDVWVLALACAPGIWLIKRGAGNKPDK